MLRLRGPVSTCERPQRARGKQRDVVGGDVHTGPMPGMRGEEQWVGACIEAALTGVKVEQHDDGSRPSMYDLDLLRDEVPLGACEVTAAADAESIELWNIINGSDKRWIEPGLLGGWIVTVTPRCRAKRLRRELPALLRTLETVTAGREGEDARDHLDGLDVMSAHRSGTDFPGSIYVTLQRAAERTGGAVPSTGNGLVTWLNGWMREPAQQHNLEKLRSADRPERHLFVLLPGFTTAPFNVTDLLVRDGAPLPDVAPTLPSGISHVWTMSTWSSGDVFRYSEGRWMRTSKIFEVAAPPASPCPQVLDLAQPCPEGQ